MFSVLGNEEIQNPNETVLRLFPSLLRINLRRIYSMKLNEPLESAEGTAVPQWLRCCATNRKATGSIPDCVIGIFH